ncbi:hypothetical protein Fcan01_20554 [Folsomia candida]|uniref:Uncharacterized protein n=1 Tax=Folsomia candida TaxID=158441 RepID=A0A226DIV0_FOLCA|nr:hypothetical protein Fcan01_20554 [Folsomia candida]
MDLRVIRHCVTLLTLYCVACETKDTIQIFKLLKGVENCDVQIVHGDLESANIQPFPNLLLPTSLIFASNFLIHRIWVGFQDWDKFAIDISKTRVSHCQLSVLFSSKFLEDGKETKFSHWTRFGTDRHFRFGKYGEEWSTSTSNTYVVLVTNYDKKEFAKVSINKYLSISSIENFGIVFNQRMNSLLELCVLRSGVMPEMQNFNCVTNMQSNFLEKFHAMQTKLQNWELTLLENTDINMPKGYKRGDIVELIKYPEFINPFDRSNINTSVHHHIAQSVFRKSNSTLSFCRSCSLMYHGEIKLDVLESIHSSPTKIQVTVGFIGYQFSSCYSEKEITFRFYIAPFQREVWYAILFGGVMVYLVMVLIVRFVTKAPEDFSIWMTVLAVMFEKWGTIPGQVEKPDYTRYLLIGWTLACLVLINLYNGLMISELNSPMARNGPEIFSDLVCSLEDAQLFHSERFKNPGERVFSKMNETLRYLDEFRVKLQYNNLELAVPPELSEIPFLEDDSCFRLLSPVLQGRLEGSLVYDFEDYLYWWYYSFRQIETLIPLRVSHNRVLLNLFHPRHARRPRLEGNPGMQDVQYATEKEIVSCGKTVFIGESPLIVAEIEYLRKRYFWIDFHKGRDVLNGGLIGWVVEQEGRIPHISRGYWAMIESGIYDRLLVEVSARKIIKEKRFLGNVTGKKISKSAMMNGGIVTLFILIFGLNLVAFENRTKINMSSKSIIAFVILMFVASVLAGKALPTPEVVAKGGFTNATITEEIADWCCPLNCPNCLCPNWSNWCYISGGLCWCAA